MVDIRLEIEEGIDRQDLTRLRKRFLSVNHDRLPLANLILTSRLTTAIITISAIVRSKAFLQLRQRLRI